MCLMLMSMTCEDKNDGYSRPVTIINQSDNDVYLCGRFTSFDGQVTKCNLHRISVIAKNGGTISHHSFEEGVQGGADGRPVLEFYLVNPNHYNEHNVFYDCDSIGIKNEILKQYTLTLSDLRRMNWTVVFPPEE